jgi:hypothetical protein
MSTTISLPRILACCDEPHPSRDDAYCLACGADLAADQVRAYAHDHQPPVEVDGPDGTEDACPGCGARFCRTLITFPATREEPTASETCDRYATTAGQGRMCTEHHSQQHGQQNGEPEPQPHVDDEPDEWPIEGHAFYEITHEPES